VSQLEFDGRGFTAKPEGGEWTRGLELEDAEVGAMTAQGNRLSVARGANSASSASKIPAWGTPKCFNQDRPKFPGAPVGRLRYGARLSGSRGRVTASRRVH